MAIDAELDGQAFTCLEGCGYCCTFPPAVSRAEEKRLRGRFPQLRIVGPKSDRRLGLQGCGACVLLQRRACTAYDVRPAHCRYFPFHVHFAEQTEVIVNRTCRGVEPGPGDLRGAFRAAVLDVVPAGEWERHAALAAATYAQFWANVEETGHDRGTSIPAAREAQDVGAAWDEALAPFAARSVVQRPFYLDPALRWLTFEPDGDGLDVLEMQEDGGLERVGHVTVPTPGSGGPRPGHLGASHPEAVARVAAGLESRHAYASQVHYLVDEADYDIGLAEAWKKRRDAVAADLAVRAIVLAGLGTPGALVEAELVRFYDAAFLDAPTIGGWL